MKIGILSDTHRNIDLAIQAIEEMDDVSGIFHLGDYHRDALELRQRTGRTFWYVAGNCDVDFTLESERVFRLNGKKILATHGHRYEPDRSLDLLVERAEELDVDIVLYGHTHKKLKKWINGRLYFNPGYMFLGKKEGTYGLIEWNGDHIDARIVSIQEKSR